MAVGDSIPVTTGLPVRSERLSPEAVRAFYELHGQDVLTFVAGVLRNTEAAHDVCQNTFQRLLEVGHEAKTVTIRGWLFKVAFHEAMLYRRKHGQQQRVLENYSGQKQEKPTDETLNSLIRTEDVQRMKSMLARLPIEQRLVVQRRLGEEKTFAAIADELALPLGTVLTRMRLAMQSLQRMFSQEDLNRTGQADAGSAKSR